MLHGAAYGEFKKVAKRILWVAFTPLLFLASSSFQLLLDRRTK
jgi:hypothetical protein